MEALQQAWEAAGSPYKLGVDLGYESQAAYRAVCNRHQTICKALGVWDLPDS